MQKLLDKNQERELLIRAQSGDSSAESELVTAYLPLVRKIVYRYYSVGERDRSYRDDVTQEGLIGIVTAIRRFDIDRGILFSTYASWWVNGYIKDFRRRMLHPVRLPHNTTYSQKSPTLRPYVDNVCTPSVSLSHLHERYNDGQKDVYPDALSCGGGLRECEGGVMLDACKDRLRKVIGYLPAKDRDYLTKKYGVLGTPKTKVPDRHFILLKLRNITQNDPTLKSIYTDEVLA